MFSRIMSAAIRGVGIEIIQVETDISSGLPVFDMVGLLSSEVRESKERVRTAIKNCGMSVPPRRITVNLAPADVRKEGGSFDLPVAVSVLAAMGMVQAVINMEETLMVGELGLDGSVRPVRGVLPMIQEGKRQGIRYFIVPEANRREGAIVTEAKVIGVSSLLEVCDILNGHRTLETEHIDIQELYHSQIKKETKDFSDIQGQESLKKAAEIAAAGMHNMLIVGPPGSGKTMVAERLPSILPKPDLEECLEITKIQSIAGNLREETLITERPFRAPHHTITEKAMTGGGQRVVPGEITLAHRGVLFLDEFAEFKSDTIDALRQPLEKGSFVLSRVSGTYRFPADFMLVAASNPCPCGYYPDRTRCTCSEPQVQRYLGRMKGPIADRIDICVGVQPVEVDQLQTNRRCESSTDIRKRVEAAVFLQRERYAGTGFRFNSELDIRGVKKYCYIGEKEKQLLRQAFTSFGMSARGYYRVIKVARTIADLEGSIHIREKHISQALGYRMIF